MKNIVRIEIPDRECLEYLSMLGSLKKELNCSGNILLTMALECLRDRIEKSFLDQVSPDRLTEIIEK